MRICLNVAVVAALTVSFVPGVAGQSGTETAVRNATEQFIAAYNAHDAKAIAALVDENCENWRGTLKGRAAHEENYSGLFERSKDLRIKLVEEIAVVLLAPDYAIHKFLDEVSGGIDVDGERVEPYERLRAFIYVRRSDKWLRVVQFTRSIGGP